MDKKKRKTLDEACTELEKELEAADLPADQKREVTKIGMLMQIAVQLERIADSMEQQAG